MKRSFFICLSLCILLFFSLSGCSKKNEEEKNTSQSVSEEEKKARKQIRDEFILAAEAIINNTNDDKAKNILNFLKENMVLALPQENSVTILESSKSKTPILFVPVTDKDISKGEFWQKIIYDDKFPAKFFQNNRLIVLNGNARKSQNTKGIFLLHEGMHAYSFLKNPNTDWKDLAIKNDEERKAFEFQFALMEKIGGKIYTDTLKKDVASIKKRLSIDKDSIEVGDEIVSHDMILSNLFGKEMSPDEASGYSVWFWVHGVFRAIEEKYPKDAENLKSSFIGGFYDKIAELQGK